MVCFENDSLSAMTFQIWLTGMSSNSPDKTGAAAMGAALVAGGAALYESMSALMIQPFGPVGVTLPKSIPDSVANFLANGEAKILSPLG